MANSTLEQCQNRTFALLSENDTSVQYDIATVTSRIITRYKDLCKGEIVRYFPNELNSLFIKGKNLPFLDKKMAIDRKTTTSISTAANIGDTTLYMDTTNIQATAGAIYSRGCIITFTGKSSTTLTGCAGVVASLSIGDTVAELFPIASLDIYKPVSIDYQDNDETSPIPYCDANDYKPGTYFMVLNNGPLQYIYIKGSTEGLHRLNYTLAPNDDDIDQPADEFLLPGTSAETCLAPLVAGELLWEAEEVEFGKEKLIAAYSNITAFYNQYNSKVNQKPQKVKYAFVTGM